MAIYLLLFDSTHAALSVSKEFDTQGLSYYSVAAPASLRAGCGIALRFQSDDPTKYLQLAYLYVGDAMQLYVRSESGGYTPLDNTHI